MPCAVRPLTDKVIRIHPMQRMAAEERKKIKKKELLIRLKYAHSTFFLLNLFLKEGQIGDKKEEHEHRQDRFVCLCDRLHCISFQSDHAECK